VRAPRVIASNLDAGLMVMECLDGASLPAALAANTIANAALVSAYADALRAVHAAGLVLGDAHPGNAFVLGSPGDRTEIAVPDLEFARRVEDLESRREADELRAFDLAFAAQYLTTDERQKFFQATRPYDELRVATAMKRLAAYRPLFRFETARQ